MFVFIAILLVAFCNFALGIIVLLKNRKNKANLTFSLFAMLLSVWMVINYLSNGQNLDYNQLLWLNRATLFLPPPALYFLLLFSMLFTNQKSRWLRTVAWTIGITSIAISFLGASSYVIAGLVPSGDVVGVEFGPLTPVYMVFITGVMLLEVGFLLVSLRRLNGLARARTMYMSVSLFVALAIITITNLIIPFYTGNYSYAVLGLFSTFIIVGGFAYSIIKLRLFDIRLVIARSVAYFLLIFTLGSLYSIATFRIGGLIFANYDIPIQQQSFGIFTALMLAFTFQPLRNFFEKITDRIFYRHSYDPQELLNSFSSILSSEIELIPLSRRARLLLAKNLHVESVNIVVLNNNKVFTESGHYVVSQLEGLAQDLSKINSPMIVTDELPEGTKKNTLNQYGIKVFALLKTHEGRVGYLLFGHKLSGDIFTDRDLEIIRNVSDQLAVAIQNAKAYVQIQRFNTTLKGKVQDATKKLREANDTLHQLDAVKDEFITMASHQLRTPLTISETYLATITDETYGKFNKKQGRAIQVAQDNIHITNGIVSDLLNISRMEVGHFHIEREAVNINDLVKQEFGHLQIKAKSQGVSLNYSEPKHALPICSLDKAKTQQAILNLIDNAINYAPKGTVNVSLESAGNNIIFQVSDDGMGVAEADQSKLFSKFYRAQNAQDNRPAGTGIGLYLVKRVVEDQGGSIIFTSQEGKGSTFGFRIPIQAPPTPKKTGL